MGAVSWMDVDEAMEALDVTRQRVHTLIGRGKLRGKTESGRTWVTRRSVRSYQERRRRWREGERKRWARAD